MMTMIVLEGLHHRDHKYDVYVSSLECLVHPRFEFCLITKNSATQLKIVQQDNPSEMKFFIPV